jgi:hypothetical protein
MIKRWLAPFLEKSLLHTPAVALLGPRQVGKTTLALKIAEDRSALYLDLENPEDLLKLSDPSAFLSPHRDKLVIVDEIQRAPDLFMVLRGLIDRNRRAVRISANVTAHSGDRDRCAHRSGAGVDYSDRVVTISQIGFGLSHRFSS